MSAGGQHFDADSDAEAMQAAMRQRDSALRTWSPMQEVSPVVQGTAAAGASQQDCTSRPTLASVVSMRPDGTTKLEPMSSDIPYLRELHSLAGECVLLELVGSGLRNSPCMFVCPQAKVGMPA